MAAESAAESSEPTTTATQRPIEPPPAPPDRLKALADGVFAIAMTLLVLELGVPIVTANNGEVTKALGEMWPEFLMYMLGFAVLGVYWLIHEMIFDAIERSDPTLAWLNVVYLMFAALIPFATALVVEYDAMTITAVFYGINMLALFFTGWAMWTYANSDRRLVAAHVDPDRAHGVRTMGLIYVAAYAVPLVLAFFIPTVSMVAYAIIIVTFIGFTVVGRSETVTIWRPRRRTQH